MPAYPTISELSYVIMESDEPAIKNRDVLIYTSAIIRNNNAKLALSQFKPSALHYLSFDSKYPRE